MRAARFVLLAFLIATPAWRGWAQGPTEVDAATLEQHVDHRVDPVYPPIAKAARISGKVVLEARIGTSGKVESVKVVSGPAMLQQSAINSLKQWTYKPFEKDGAPTAATGQVTIEFSLGINAAAAKEDEVIAQRYFAVDGKCRQAVSARNDPAIAATVCKQAAEIADEFAPDARFIEKRSAYVWASYAFMSSGDLKAALAYANKAVDVVKLGHDGNSGSNAAYSVKGTAEAKMGDLAAADLDLTMAEDFGRKGIAWVEKEAPSLRDEYRRPLVHDLRFHAQVLQGPNRPDEAQKKLDEAAKYE